jgi:hypothetical protein
MEKKFQQKGVAVFNGMTVSPQKVITLKFKLRYDEVVTSVNLLQGLNTDITVHAKIGTGKAVNLGMFTIGGISFDRDGNAVIPFKSMVDNVNMDSIQEVLSADKEELIQLRFMAVLELPVNEEE